MGFQYRILYSQPHDFLFCPVAHPDKAGTVAAKGWRCVAECEFEGIIGKAESCFAASQSNVEESAKILALSAWTCKYETSKAT
jgi:hypothetical protein